MPLIHRPRSETAGNNRVHPSTRAERFGMESLSRVPGDACRYLADHVSIPQSPYDPEPRPPQSRPLWQDLKQAVVAISTAVSVVALLLFSVGWLDPGERSFSVAPHLHVFIYPYGWNHDIAIANYGYTSLQDMRHVTSRYRFDFAGIHFMGIRWPEVWGLSLRVHLLYPAVVFALPLITTVLLFILAHRGKHYAQSRQ